MDREILVYDGLQSCPYRPGQVARMPLYRQRAPVELDEADHRFANCERRVGRSLYATACPTCSACKGIRLIVDAFKPTKSQRRVLKRWPEGSRIVVGPPTVTDEKLALYNRHKNERSLNTDSDLRWTRPAIGLGWSTAASTPSR